MNFGLQEENTNISKPQGKTSNWENGMGYHRKRERQMDRMREKEGGRMQCFMMLTILKLQAKGVAIRANEHH